MYVLLRTDGKGLAYVAKSGGEQSYTNKLENAQVFSTKEAAEADRCVENESIRSIRDILGVGYGS